MENWRCEVRERLKGACRRAKRASQVFVKHLSNRFFPRNLKRTLFSFGPSPVTLHNQNEPLELHEVLRL